MEEERLLNPNSVHLIKMRIGLIYHQRRLIWLLLCLGTVLFTTLAISFLQDAPLPGNTRGPDSTQHLQNSLDSLNTNLRRQENRLAAEISDRQKRDSLSGEQTAIIAKPVNNRWGIMSMILRGICLLALLLAIMMGLLGKKIGPYVVTAAASALLDLAIDAKFDFKPEFKLDFKPEIRICACDTGQVAQVQDTTTIIQLGPFVAGFDSLAPDAEKFALNRLNHWLTDTSITEIHIFGGVDQRPLVRKARARFGDNLTLSQARANAIQDKINAWYARQQLIRRPLLYTHVKGADSHSDSVNSEAFYSQSRYVSVYGIRHIRLKSLPRQRTN